MNECVFFSLHQTFKQLRNPIFKIKERTEKLLEIKTKNLVKLLGTK